MSTWADPSTGEAPEFTPSNLVASRTDAFLELFGLGGFFTAWLLLVAGVWVAFALGIASVVAIELLVWRAFRRLRGPKLQWFRRGLFKAVIRNHLMRPTVIRHAWRTLPQ